VANEEKGKSQKGGGVLNYQTPRGSDERKKQSIGQIFLLKIRTRILDSYLEHGK